MGTHPLRVLVGSDEELYNPGDGSVLSEWGMVGRTQGQVADQAHHSLDEWPATGWVEQLDQHRKAIVQPHSILGHLSFLVATGQVTQRTYLRMG